ncbi:hypothetical protein [Thermosulfurimonas sp. F29]|uniref:hypothetical protein n=1 Tax=Thermosulfurimonas sp. F29 TaxID=2867247 RepID=UPI001C831938|nr:hypothetical protein [Thermosulfurimonas sp. F29]MBX6423801.1 hypothetical protein [Thermosulfurimonas sp. F29]
MNELEKRIEALERENAVLKGQVQALWETLRELAKKVDTQSEKLSTIDGTVNLVANRLDDLRWGRDDAASIRIPPRDYQPDWDDWDEDGFGM